MKSTTLNNRLPRYANVIRHHFTFFNESYAKQLICVSIVFVVHVDIYKACFIITFYTHMEMMIINGSKVRYIKSVIKCAIKRGFRCESLQSLCGVLDSVNPSQVLRRGSTKTPP